MGTGTYLSDADIDYVNDVSTPDAGNLLKASYEAVTPQPSAPEIAVGVETALRTWSVANVLSMISTHASGMAAATYDPAGIAQQLVGLSATQTLTNKTISAASNTIVMASTNLSDTATIARTSTPLSQFTATTSAQLAGVISDETGSGSLVFGTSPTLSGTPSLPATYMVGSNLFTRTGAHNLTLVTSGISSVTLPTSGTLATLAGTETLTNKTITAAGNTLTIASTDLSDSAGLGRTANPLSQFAATTSAQLAGVVSDETGSGALVFGTSPTLVTPALGTPSTIVLTNATGTAASLTAGQATTALALESATTTVSVSGATAPTTGQVLTATSATTATWQAAGGGDALTSNPLSQFAATTSAQLAGVISNETGSGALVFGTSPTLVTPDLGTPSAVVLTNATGTAASLIAGQATTALALESATTTVSVSAATAPTTGQALIATSATTATWQTLGGGGDALTSGSLAQFAATTSAELAGVISNETGSGLLVFGTSPTLVTPALGTPSSIVLTNATGTAASLTAGQATTALALESATTTVSVSGATAPTTGQALIATSATTATWQTLGGGGDALTSGSLAQFAATTSAELAGVISNETGSGLLVFGTSPTLVTPNLGTPSTIVLTNATGTAASLTAGQATTALALESATTTVSVSAATAPTTGQVLTAINSTSASWQTQAGGGDMSAATYDPATIAEQLVGLTATQTLTNKTITAAGNTLTIAASDLSNADFLDTVFRVQDNLDPTKEIAFQGSAITTLTTRTITMPDADVTLADIALNTTHRSSDGSDHTFIDQSVVSGSAPTFLATNITALNATNLSTGTIPAARVGANHIDAITEIASALKSGADLTLMTGTAGTSGNLAQFNVDGDVVDSAVATANLYSSGGTDVAVTDGGTGRSTSTTAYGLIAAGTTATGAHQTLATGATTTILVGGGAGALPTWETASGSGAPVRATSPALVTPDLGTPTALVLTSATGLPTAGLVDEAVTYAKMQHISATDRLLGRSTAGAGDVEEIICTAAGRAILDDASATAQRTTLGLAIGSDVQAYDADLAAIAALSGTAGAILYYNSGWQVLAAGSNGQVLELAAGLPSWETAAGGGNMTADGTPVDSQIGIWTSPTNQEGDVDLTFATASNTLALAGVAGTSIMSVGGANILVDSPRGTMTLSNVDALDATTEATIDTALRANVMYEETYIDAGAQVPRTTNGAATQTEEYVTNDVMADQYLFDPGATVEGIQLKWAIPDSWDLSTIKVKVHWDVVTAGSGGVTWGVAARATGDSDAIDGAFGTRVDVDDTVLTVGDNHITAATAAITVGNTPAQGDLIWFEITRQTGDANDTCAVDAKLLGIQVQWGKVISNATAW